jgi:hypothetical protein
VKLFPVEGVILAPLIPAIAEDDRVLTYLLTAVVVALIILLRSAATRPKQGGRPDWIAVGVSVVSFMLYAAALKIFGLILQPQQKHVLLMSFLTIAWVAAVPTIPQRAPATSAATAGKAAAGTGTKRKR